MEIVYACVLSPGGDVLCELRDDSAAARSSARRASAAYRGSGGSGPPARFDGSNLTVLVQPSACVPGGMVAVAARREGFSAPGAQALLAAVASLAPAAGRAALLATVERYAGEARLLQRGDSALDALSTHLERLKESARASADDLLERGGRLDALVERSERLATSGGGLRRQAKALRTAQQWRDGATGWACTIMLLAALAAAAYAALRFAAAW